MQSFFEGESWMGEFFLSKQDQFRYRQLREFMEGKVSRLETARLVQLSERSVTRLAGRIHELGIKAVVHGHRGRVAPNVTDKKLKLQVLKLVEEKYWDFNMTHCLEILRERHKLEVPYGPFRRWCHEKQLVKRKKRRRAKARHLRSRMPAEGYLLQMDGSPHYYNGVDIWHLIIAIDDATSEIPYAEFCSYEDTLSCMRVIKTIIKKKGIPRAIYVDRAGWSGGQKRVEFSQFKRACEELGIMVLFAESPQAKGRVERAHDTFQDRIIPELRVRKLKTMAQANEYLNSTFLPEYWNVKNVVQPRQLHSEYRRLDQRVDLEQIFCIKKSRALAADHTFSFGGLLYAIRSKLERSLKGKRIELRFYANHLTPMSIYFEDKKLEWKKVHVQRKHQQAPDESYESYAARIDEWLKPKKKNRDTNRIKNLVKNQRKIAKRDIYAEKLSGHL
jgi:hypothetical protein